MSQSARFRACAHSREGAVAVDRRSRFWVVLTVSACILVAAGSGWLVFDRVMTDRKHDRCRAAYIKCRRFCEDVADRRIPAERPTVAGPCEWPLSERGRSMRPLRAQPTDGMWFEACAAQCGLEGMFCFDLRRPCAPGSLSGTR